MKFQKSGNVMTLVGSITTVLIALYAGGILMDALGDLLLHTANPFYQGLNLIGYTVGSSGTNGTAGYYYKCTVSQGDWALGTLNQYTAASWTNCITSTAGSGVLAVIGIIALMKIISLFVRF
jgi:hypothetical protein